MMKPPFLLWIAFIPSLLSISCLNPFAPHLDNSPAETACDPTSVEGVFQCFQKSYSSRDTTLYGGLLEASFSFVYRDYDLGIDVTWGRDEELRTTYGLFQNAQRLDLIWNNIVSISTDYSTRVNVVRGFNLTIIFNPNDIERVDGYANLTLERARITDPWKIIRWRDESNF
jgi:hypothetical protein